MRFEVLNVKGTEYKLRFSTYCLEQLERNTGIDIFSEDNGLEQLIKSIKGLKSLVFWGLKTTHKELKEEEIYDILDYLLEEMGIEELSKKLMNALSHLLKLQM